LGELFLEKMEISESFFGKNHGKLAHLRNLAPKIIYDNDLNQLEEEFGQEERRLEEEIITLKIQLQEAKRIEEVMKSQIMKT
jgi:hypothetical protein